MNILHGLHLEIAAASVGSSRSASMICGIPGANDDHKFANEHLLPNPSLQRVAKKAKKENMND